MNSKPHPSDSSDDVKMVAARWLARRDRGLTAEEQDEYLQWLRDDAQRGRVIAELDDAWKRLNLLSDWRPKHSVQPNPDLLAPRRAWWRRTITAPTFYVTLATAAVVAVGIYAWQPKGKAERPDTVMAQSGVKVLPGPEKLTLADGSVVELNEGGRIQTDFTPGERRVRLTAGEALFTVTKNPARPFIVEAGAVSVRAVGTAFDVRRGSAEVEVLVTEGKVRLERPATGDRPTAPTPLVAGQRAVIDAVDLARAPHISSILPAEFEHDFAWRAVRLDFANMPLTEVVAEFNLRNTQQLVIADIETGKLRLGGTFRADNVDGFVRLLEATLGVTAERRSDGSILLRRGR